MIFKHLRCGWEHPDFEDKVNELVKTMEETTSLRYYDIKVDSKGNNCLVIFK